MARIYVYMYSTIARLALTPPDAAVVGLAAVALAPACSCVV